MRCVTLQGELLRRAVKYIILLLFCLNINQSSSFEELVFSNFLMCDAFLWADDGKKVQGKQGFAVGYHQGC